MCSKLTQETRGSLESLTKSRILAFGLVPLKASAHVQPNFVFPDSSTHPAVKQRTFLEIHHEFPSHSQGSRLHDLLSSSSPPLVIPAVPVPSLLLSESLQTPVLVYLRELCLDSRCSAHVLSLCGHTHPFP